MRRRKATGPRLRAHWRTGKKWGTSQEGMPGDLTYAYDDGVPRCDARLLDGAFAQKRLKSDGTYGPSLLEEFAERGYDLTTLTFSIRKAPPPPKDPTP